MPPPLRTLAGLGDTAVRLGVRTVRRRRTFSLVPALPSRSSADGSPPFVRTLRRYYGPLRLLRPVHVGRTALAFTHRPAANSRAGRKSPGSRAESFLTCPGASTAPGPVAACASATPDVAFPSSQQGRPPKRVISRLHSPARRCLCQTLHPRCHHRRRMTRGQRGSLFLRCGAPSSPTLCRFIPALS